MTAPPQVIQTHGFHATPRQWCALVLGVFLFAALFQGSRPLLDPDEGRYSAVALEMLRSGDWLHPALGPEQAHLTKPPLVYWVIAGSMGVLGTHEWALRLPYALALALTAALVAALAQALKLRQPLWAGAMYPLMFWPFLSANIATTDVFLTLFETLGAFGYVRLWQAVDIQALRRARLLLALGFGLAFLTKGPPGLLPLIAFALHSFWVGRWRGLRKLFDLPSLTVFVLVAGSWYAAAILTTPDLLDYYLRKEVVGRLAGEHSRNPQLYRAFLLYLPTLIFGSLPWAGYWLSDAWKQARHSSARDDTRRFLWFWFAVPLIVFMLAKSRLAMYVLPLFVPLALWSALVMEQRGGLRALGRWWRHGLALWMLALIVAKAGLAYAPVKEYAGPLAVELEAALGAERVERIATVGTKSHYGLRLYTGKIVEHFSFNAADPNHLTEVCERLRKMPVPRAFLVNPGYYDRFERDAPVCGITLQARGSLRGMRLYLGQ